MSAPSTAAPMLQVPDPNPTIHITGKRKRDDEVEDNINGITINGVGGKAGPKSEQLCDLLKDIVDVLKRSTKLTLAEYAALTYVSIATTPFRRSWIYRLL